MAEFNRTSLDIMDELYAPFKEAQAQKHGLERQAGGAALARQLQLTDADTKRQQQLTDADTAHQSGLERITHQVEAQAQVGEDVAARLKKDKLVERREEAAFLWKKLDKANINTGFTISEINNATSGALAAMSAGMHLEVNTLTANKKTRTEILEKLKSYERTEAGRLALQTALGTADPIDWEAEGQESKAYLDDLFGDVHSKVELQKLVGTVGYTTYKRNKRIQMEALEDTGIMDFMTRSSGDDRKEAAKWLARLPGFEEQLLQSITDDSFTLGDQRPDKLEAVMAHLGRGDLTQASAYLEREGEAGNQPLIEGITRWAAQDASEAQTRMQIQILSKQGALQKLTSVNREINDYIGRHPEVEGQPVEDFYSNEEWDAFQGRRRAAQGQPQSMEPGDRGLEGTTLFNQAGEVTDDSGEVVPGQVGSDPNLGGNLGGLASPADVASFVDPQAAPAPLQGQVVESIDANRGKQQYTALPGEDNLQTIANKLGVPLLELIRENPAVPLDQVLSGQILYIPPAFGRFDRDGDGTLDAYEKLLKADEEEGFASGRAGGSIDGGTITADERSWGGKQLDKAGNYLFPRHMAGEQQASLLERYDPDADYWGLLTLGNSYAPGDAPSDIRAGAGDVVLEFGGMLADAWLAAGGINILRSAPAALSRVKALVSKPIVSGVGAFGRTAASRKAAMLTPQVSVQELAKALGGGAALESLKAFVKTPANIKEAVRRIRQSGMRYSPGAVPKAGAGAFGRTPGSLNFTPSTPESLGRMGLNYRPPIVPPAPTP